MTICITPPDLNDSFSRIALLGKEYLLRFSWNDTGGFWTFGLYDMQQKPYIAGIRILPNVILNFFYQSHSLPDGFFLVKSGLETIGRDDFKNKKAQFLFVPAEDLKEG